MVHVFRGTIGSRGGFAFTNFSYSSVAWGGQFREGNEEDTELV
jgi:hypothetical protein